VKLVRHGIHLDAVRRQDGLTAMLDGHAGLAMVMGRDEEMTQVLSERTITVCETCAAKPTSVYEMGLREEQ